MKDFLFAALFLDVVLVAVVFVLFVYGRRKEWRTVVTVRRGQKPPPSNPEGNTELPQLPTDMEPMSFPIVPYVTEPAKVVEARLESTDRSQTQFLEALVDLFRSVKASVQPAQQTRERVTLGKPREHITAPPDWRYAVKEIEGRSEPGDPMCIARQKALEAEGEAVAKGFLPAHLAAGVDERARIERALGFAAKRKNREQGDI